MRRAWTLWMISPVIVLLHVCVVSTIPSLIPSERCQIVNMGIFLDTSSGVLSNATALNNLQDFITRIIGRLDTSPGKSDVGVVQFASVPSLQRVNFGDTPTSVSDIIISFTTNSSSKQDMYAAVDSLVPLTPNNTTSPALGTFLLSFGSVTQSRPGAHNVALLVTDGRSVLDYTQVIPVADSLRDTGIDVFVLGIDISVPADQTKLLGVVGNKSSNVVYVSSYSVLLVLVDTVIGLQCIVDTSPAACQTITDIAFIIDDSSSIVAGDDAAQNSWYRDILGFVSSLILYFNVSSDLAHVGVVKFSDTAGVYIYLTNYTSVDTLLPAVRNLVLFGGNRDTAAGLRVTGTSLFNVTNGFRPAAASIALLITNGAGNIEVNQTIAQATQLKTSLGVEVFTVGVSSLINSVQLQAIASTPASTHYTTVASFDTMDGVVNQVASSICNATVRASTTRAASSTTTTTTPTTTSLRSTTTLSITPNATTTRTATMASNSIISSRNPFTPTPATLPPPTPTQARSAAPTTSGTPVNNTQSQTTTTTTISATINTTTSTVTIRYGTMNRSFGPVAGGTKVMLKFDVNLPDGPYLINFSNNANGSRYNVSANISGVNQLTFVTSGVNDVDTGDWSVSLSQTTSQRYMASTSFIYRSNPVIQAISPTYQSIFGGTRMTVSGSHLNSVAYPLVQALVNVYRPDQQNSGNSTMMADTPGDCMVNENIDYQLICLMPNLNLPQDFIDKLNQDADNETKRKRRDVVFTHKILHRLRRQVLSATILGPNNSRADVRIAFTFDGYGKYLNGANLSSGLNFEVPIQIPPAGHGVIFYYPLSDPFLRIKGHSLTRVGSIEDYNVLIGSDSCVVTQLTDNLLTCTPPNFIPTRRINDTLLCTESATLQVQIMFAGGAPYYYSCLQYVADDTGLLIAALTGGVTSLIVVIILLITTIVCCYQAKHRAKEDSESEQVEIDDRFNDGQESEEPEIWEPDDNDANVLQLTPLQHNYENEFESRY